MKIRQGFVSNSSSASFAILKKHLTEFQMEAIRNHIRYANGDFSPLELIAMDASPDLASFVEKMRSTSVSWRDSGKYEASDAWDVRERVCPDTNEPWIGADTDMDNFDFKWFLNELGISDEHIRHAWSHEDDGEWSAEEDEEEEELSDEEKEWLRIKLQQLVIRAEEKRTE